MAMFHVQPLLLFLLASLFFLPALRAAKVDVDFEYCNEDGDDYGKVHLIEIYWNSTVVPGERPTFSIYLTASASKDISRETTVYVAFKSSQFTGLLKKYNICDVGGCNNGADIKAGTGFLLLVHGINDVGFREETMYDISLRQGNTKEKICVQFKLPTSAPALVSA